MFIRSSSKEGLFLSVYVDDIKMAGKTENIKLTWKILMKDVDLEEPTSFLDHVYLGCTQRECTIINETCSNPEFLLEPRKNYLQALSGKPDAEIRSSWSYDMEVHAKKCVKRCCELANLRIKRLRNYIKSQHYAWMTITYRPVGGFKSTQSCVFMPTKNCRRSNKNGETRKGGGARH